MIVNIDKRICERANCNIRCLYIQTSYVGSSTSCLQNLLIRWQRSTKLRALSGEQTAVRSALYFALCKLLRSCKAARVTFASITL